MLEDFESSLLGSLPDQLERLWGALEPDQVELETLPAELVERMLAADGRARIEVLPREDLGENAALVAFVDGVREAAPQATGSAVAVLEWARAVVRSFQQALTGAFVAVALVVWLLWRRGRDLLLVLAPLVLAAVLTGAAAVILGIRFNFANVLVLPLLLGVGVDSGIHLVHRHRVLEAGAAAGSAGRVLLGSSTAQAVFFSALTTMGSFGSLVFATHRGFSSLGQLLLIGVTLTLACNLLVLPALIAGTSKRG
jgi:predicted RND superfamily exporter protein